MLISVHVPKAAGSSFREVLHQHFGAQLLLDYADRPLAPGHRWRRFRADLRTAAGKSAALAPYACVHGHFVADKYAFLGGRARLVTWLRDPVQRVASHYHYWQRQPDLRNPDCRALIERKLSLADFAALPRMRNVMARFLGQVPLRDFYFVGLVEDLPASLTRFWRLTGIDVDAHLHVNRNDDLETGSYELTPALRAHLEQLNRRDRELYESARAMP